MFARGFQMLPETILVCYVLTDEGPRLALVDGAEIVSISPALFLTDDMVKVEVETTRGTDVLCVLCADAGALLRSPLSIDPADVDLDDDEVDYAAIQRALLPPPGSTLPPAAAAHFAARAPLDRKMQDKPGPHSAGKACAGAKNSVVLGPRMGVAPDHIDKSPAYRGDGVQS